MIIDKRRKSMHKVPGLNTASLPDLIFTVLFFFMIVTHMQRVAPKVKYQVPQGKELTRLTKKSAITYIYIGKPLKGMGERQMIQINDKYVPIDKVSSYMIAERNRMSAEDLPQMTVSLKADKSTPMDTINAVKQALRRANTLKINYSATETSHKIAKTN